MRRLVPGKQGVERLRPQKQWFCSDGAWHELLEAMNEKKERVRVSRSALEEVEGCHASREHYLDRLARAPGRKWVVIDRLALWNLVQAHSVVCQQ